MSSKSKAQPSEASRSPSAPPKLPADALARGRSLGGPVRALAIVLLVAVAGGVVAMAGSDKLDPTRCPHGMVALGARCCGEGQTLSERGACTGRPRICPVALRPTANGCEATAQIIALPGGKLQVSPEDWEASGQLEPFETTVKPFRLDKYEVTAAQYLACASAGACVALAAQPDEPTMPVVRVTIEEAETYCQWQRGHLPSSDQLAFASGGTESRRYPWGPTGAVCRRVVWGLVDGPCARGGSTPDVVGSRPDGDSPQGIADLAGNVAEWCHLSRGQPRVVHRDIPCARGGSFADNAAAPLRTWHLRGARPGIRAPDVGFRCAYPADP